MAPALVVNTLLPSTTKIEKVPPESIVPDDLDTSGQHPPLYHKLRGYEAFPEHITGKTVWDADDYKNSPRRWTHQLTEEEIFELSDAAGRFTVAEIPLTGISKVP